VEPNVETLSLISATALEALQDLPTDATFDDAIERLVFLAKIEEGLAELDAGKGIPHNEVRRRLGRDANPLVPAGAA